MHDFGKIVYLGLQKSGSSFVNKFLSECCTLEEKKFRKHGAALFHIAGKKVGNLNVFSRYGVTINLLRTEENGYRFPNISHEVKNMRNDTKGCEYYTIINISSLDEDIKSCIKTSYDVRDKKQTLLKRNHPNVNEILGLTEQPKIN